MAGKSRKFARVTKFLLAGVTLFCVSWIVSVNEWHSGVRWRDRQVGITKELPTMRTIVAYSARKQEEMDRPSLVTCDRLPAFPNIPHFNRSWSPGVPNQSSWQRVPGTQVSLYAAYYDERTAQRYIRILGSFYGRNFTSEKTLFCQTRSFNQYEESVEVVAAKPLEIWWNEWDAISSNVDTPLLLSCPLTEPLKRHSIVSIVTEPCDDPTNAFKLETTQANVQYKRNFTICVKDMNFGKDISQNLVEWIETNKILGVDIIDIYVDKISKEAENVLQHYRDKAYVRLFHVPINNSSNRSLWQRRRDHIITYNDCLYRNINESEFVIPLDVDEIVLPKIAYTWPELLHRLKEHGWNSTDYSSILIHNVFFFDSMQRAINIKSNIQHLHKNKTYMKRDDVRIENDNNLSIELVDADIISKEVIDVNDEVIYDKYKKRCGRRMLKPKLARHVVSSAVISPVGYYSKSWMLTKKVLTAFNHYPLASLGSSGFNEWSAPFSEVQLNHYKESCNATVVAECGRYQRRARIDRAALRLQKRLIYALADSVCIK